MELTLALKPMLPHQNDNGVTRIGNKSLVVIDNKTGDELETKTGLIWGDRALLTKPLDEPLLTDEHLAGDPDDAGYMILVIRCDKAIELKKPHSYFYNGVKIDDVNYVYADEILGVGANTVFNGVTTVVFNDRTDREFPQGSITVRD